MNKIVTKLNKEVKIRLSLADTIFGALVVVVNLFLATVGVGKFIDEGYGNAFGVTPKTFPRFIFLAAIVLGAVLVVQSLNKFRKQDPNEKMISFHLISLAILLVIIVFVATLKVLGYPIANMILMICMYWLSGGKSWKTCLIMSVAFTVCSVLFFYTYLNLSIPMGLLEFIIG